MLDHMGNQRRPVRTSHSSGLDGLVMCCGQAHHDSRTKEIGSVKVGKQIIPMSLFAHRLIYMLNLSSTRPISISPWCLQAFPKLRNPPVGTVSAAASDRVRSLSSRYWTSASFLHPPWSPSSSLHLIFWIEGLPCICSHPSYSASCSVLPGPEATSSGLGLDSTSQVRPISQTLLHLQLMSAVG